jgi:hypothetical protein
MVVVQTYQNIKKGGISLMHKIEVVFADGSTQFFHEDQIFMAVGYFPDKDDPEKQYPAQSRSYSLWNHVHDGLIPSFLELLANSKFFFELDKPSVVYSANAVVKIKNL